MTLWAAGEEHTGSQNGIIMGVTKGANLGMTAVNLELT